MISFLLRKLLHDYNSTQSTERKNIRCVGNQEEIFSTSMIWYVEKYMYHFVNFIEIFLHIFLFVFQERPGIICLFDDNMRSSYQDTNCSQNCEQTECDQTEPIKHHGSKLPIIFNWSRLVIIPNFIAYHLDLLQDIDKLPVDPRKSEIFKLWWCWDWGPATERMKHRTIWQVSVTGVKVVTEWEVWRFGLMGCGKHQDFRTLNLTLINTRPTQLNIWNWRSYEHEGIYAGIWGVQLVYEVWSLLRGFQFLTEVSVCECDTALSSY